MIPCKENKCILQAACKSKTFIECFHISDYVQEKLEGHPREKVWALLKQYFKNLKTLKTADIEHPDGGIKYSTYMHETSTTFGRTEKVEIMNVYDPVYQK